MNKQISTIFFSIFLFIGYLTNITHGSGRLIITGFKGTSPKDPQVIQLKQAIDQHQIGGVILFKRNIINKTQLKALIAYLKKDTPILVAIDHEGGVVNRLTDPSFNLKTPSPDRFCKLNQSNQISIANQVSSTLKDIGINLNLGGVVDIEPLIYTSSICRYKRCYGQSQNDITHCAKILLNSHQKENILFALKHFPGHGSTPIDSHYRLPNISKNHTPYDFMPYRNLIDANSSQNIMVMVGHLMIRDIDPKYPASLSKNHIDLLKNELHFNGLIITDDLNMGALHEISKNKVTIAKKALTAGNHLLLFEYLTFSEIEKINAFFNQNNHSEELNQLLKASLHKLNQYL